MLFRSLRTLGLRRGGIEVVSCPTCGRTRIDLIGLANQVETMVQEYPLDLKVAVMGCVVNGPGEAREADFVSTTTSCTCSPTPPPGRS